MFSSPIESLESLRALVRQNIGKGAAHVAQVFELKLRQSRFGWMEGESENDGTSISSGNWMNQQQSILNHLASRVPTSKLPSVPSSKNIFNAYQSLESKKESGLGEVPRSIPLMANRAAEKHGVPGKLFRRLIWVESEFNPKAVSPRGAMGLGQLMPETARELGLSLDSNGGKGTVWDPESNLDASARYLKWLHKTFVNKGVENSEAWRFSAAAYNAGIGNISKAMGRAGEGENAVWNRVAQHLPRVTGKASEETFNYLARLRL